MRVTILAGGLLAAWTLLLAGGAAALADTSREQTAIEGALEPLVRYEGDPQTSTLAERMKSLGVPGLSIAVVVDGRIAWAAGYGLADASEKTPVTSETLFQAASISKPVNAPAALRLVAAGKLALDADINGYLHRWKIPANKFTADDPVTLRLLLSHRGGTSIHGFPGYAAGAPIPTLADILNGAPPANTKAVIVERRPGKEFVYSGGGTTIVQMTVEDVTGEPLAVYLAREVLTPLAMTASTFEQPLPAERVSQATSGHGSDGQPIAGRFHTYPEQSAAGLWTTPSDLCRYALGVRKAVAGESGAILPVDLAKQMIAPVGDGPVGLGPFLTIDDGHVVAFGHSGGNEGFRCDMLALVDRPEAAVVMTNSNDGGQLMAEVLRAIAREYRWPGDQRSTTVVVKPTAADVEPLLGKYAMGLGGRRRSCSATSACSCDRFWVNSKSTFNRPSGSSTRLWDSTASFGLPMMERSR